MTGDERAKNWPIEKVVSVPADEAIRLHRVFQIKENIKRAILDILESSYAEQAQREELAWDDIAKLAGYESMNSAATAGCHFMIDHIARQIIVRKKP